MHVTIEGRFTMRYFTLGFLLIFQITTALPVLASAELSDAEVSEQLDYVVQLMSPDLPTKIDETTILVRVENTGARSMRYTYTLDLGGSFNQEPLIKMFRNTQDRYLGTNFCNEKGFWWYRQNNVGMIWRYADPTGRQIATISKNSSDC
ncbi:hypothetical protein N9445_01540 [bacterium]|nr:hypothetical protein [bacterium]